MIYEFFASCSCPRIWHGVAPPSCLVHNPPPLGFSWTTTTTTEPLITKGKKRKKRSNRDKE